MKTKLLLMIIGVIMISCNKVDIQPENPFGQITEQLVDTISIGNLKFSSVNLMPNAGGTNTTDWQDSNKDGLADGWSKDYPLIAYPSTAAIEFLNCPFDANVQTISNRTHFFLASPKVNLPVSKYILSFIYTSTSNRVAVTIRYSNVCGYVKYYLPKTSEPLRINLEITTNIVQVVFYNSMVRYNEKLCIDQVEIYKQ